MRNVTTLWLLPVAIFKWTMFSMTFVQKKWDTCSYSVTIQYTGRIWSPTYWLRVLVLVFVTKFKIKKLADQIKTEINILSAPQKALTGHIKPKIPKPIRYIYLFTTLYTA